MKKKSAYNIFYKLALITIMITYGGCSDKGAGTKENVVAKPQAQNSQKNKPLVFEFPDSNNQKITVVFENQKIKFKNYPNKIILLDFFGKRCPPCLAEIPHLVNLQNKYKDQFQILAIQVQERMDVFERANFIKSKNINYTLVDDDQAGYFISFVQQITNWPGSIPFMLMFTPEGEVVQFYRGMVPEEMIEGDIKKALGEYKK
jgi:thiol-disulfide isomerase/thioredoxin